VPYKHEPLNDLMEFVFYCKYLYFHWLQQIPGGQKAWAFM
jgi:hypothetical protein